MSEIEKVKKFDNELFIYRLNDILYSRQLSLSDLASATGIDIANLSRYTRGKYSPNLASLVSIATSLDVSVDYLLGLDGEVVKKASEIKNLAIQYKGASAREIEDKADEIIKMYSGSRK